MTEQWPSKEQEIWFQAGVSGERERIIKLLKKHNCTLDGCHHSDNLCSSPHHLALLVELIKGETNE